MAISINNPSAISNWFKQRKAVFPRKYRAYFFLTLSDLYSQGFSLGESLSFMTLLLPKYGPLMAAIKENLGQGLAFEQAIAPLKMPLSVVAQLFYAEKQGRFGPGLGDIGRQLADFEAYRKQLIKVLSYPLLLGVFLIGLLFGIREFMLPQLASFISQKVYDSNFLVRLLILFFSFLPQIFLTLTGLILIIYLLVDLWLLKQEGLKRYNILVKFPLIRKWVRKYCSYKFTRELAHFYASGYSLQQTCQLLIRYPVDPYLAALAQALSEGFLSGESLSDQLSDLGIFMKELPFVIQKGEITSRLAHQCQIYSHQLFKDLMEDIQKTMGFIQPLLFLLIALLVMAMYLLMMLPMLTMDGI